jgi:predicted transposase/invertase (TIGR01784 family)
MSDPNNPHDALAKRTYSNPSEVAELLRAVLPPELLRHLDLSTLRLAPGSFVDEALRSAYSDLLFTVEFDGRPALIYLLFEHLSTVDGLVPLRLLRYLVNILEKHVADAAGKKSPLPLPLVIPVVLHHSDKGWTGPTRLGDLFDPQVLANPALRPFIPDFGFCLDDISHISDQQLRQRSLSAASTLTLWALRDARNAGRILDTLEHFADLMARLQTDPGGRSALALVLRYILLVAEIPADVIVQRLTTLAPGTKEDIMTPAEQWIAQGEARGVEKGRAEGRVEGRVEGLAEMFLRQLSLRFGKVPDSTAERIRRASETELMRWGERVLTARALDEVLRDESEI